MGEQGSSTRRAAAIGPATVRRCSTPVLVVVGLSLFVSGLFVLAAAGTTYPWLTYLFLLASALAFSVPLLLITIVVVVSERLVGRAWANGLRRLDARERGARATAARSLRYAAVLWLANGAAMWFATVAAQFQRGPSCDPPAPSGGRSIGLAGVALERAHQRAEAHALRCELLRGEIAERRREAAGTGIDDLAHQRAPSGGETHPQRAPVALVRRPLDVAEPLEAIDDAGEVGRRHPHRLRDFLRPCGPEPRGRQQRPYLRHRQPGAHQWVAAQRSTRLVNAAPEAHDLAHRFPQGGTNGTQRFVVLGGGGRIELAWADYADVASHYSYHHHVPAMATTSRAAEA